MRTIRVLVSCVRMLPSASLGLYRRTDDGNPAISRGRLTALCFSVLGGLLVPGLAAALSLGQIQVSSYLNQPFRAEIPVRDLQPGELAELEARLADDQAFARYGLQRNAFLNGLQFNLRETDGGKSAVLEVTSSGMAKEPFFSFLLQLKAPRESFIREYTVLLDPSRSVIDAPEPESAAIAPQPVAQPAPVTARPTAPSASQAAAPAATPVPTPAPASAPVITPRAKPRPGAVVYDDEVNAGVRTEAMQPVVSDGRYGPIRAGETLWGIAAAVRPTARVTMNQVMWALFDANPAAFDGNINRVRKGAVLVVPSETKMLEISAVEANQRFADASRQPRERPVSKPAAPEVIALETVSAPIQPKPAPQATPKLPPKPTPEAPKAVSKPALEPKEPAVQVVKPAEPLPELPLEELSESSSSDVAQEEYEELPPLSSEPDVEQLEPETAEAPSSMDESDTGSSLPLIPILAGLGVVLLGGLAFFALRRRKKTDADKAAPAATAPASVPEVAAAVPAAAAAAAAVETLDDLPELDEATGLSEEALAATAQFEQPLLDQDSASLTQDLEGLGGAQDTLTGDEDLAELDLPDLDAEPSDTIDLGADTVALDLNEDPLSEADFQLAYGLYDEAALLLTRAIETEPERVELREKLVETYFAAGDAGQFRQAAQELQGCNPGEEVWQRVAIMGQQLCPGDSLFGTDLPAADSTSMDLDMDFAGDAADGQDEASSDSNVLEFELDDVAEPEPELAASSSDADELSLEADFGDLELDVADSSSEPADEDALAEFGDLDLGDLEAELVGNEDSAADDSMDLGELGLELEEADTPSEPDDNSIEFELPDVEVDAETEAPASSDALAADELSLESAEDDSVQATDFDLGELDSSQATDFDLGEDTAETDALSLTSSDDDLELSLDLPDDSSGTDFDLDDAFADAGESASAAADSHGDSVDDLATSLDLDADLSGEEPALELGDLDADLTLDPDLGDLGLEGDSADLELSSKEDADAGLELELDDDLDLGDLGQDSSGADLDLSDLGDSGDLDDDLDLSALDDSADDSLDLSALEVDSDDADLAADLGLDDSSTDFGELDDLDLADESADEIAGGGDEAATKLDLARAYVDMGEAEMARGLLEEVVEGGSAEQKSEAQGLLDAL